MCPTPCHALRYDCLCTRRRIAPRGTAYIVVLGISMVVTVIGLGALALTHTQRAIAAANSDHDEARVLAVAGLEMGHMWVNSDANWRVNQTNGVWAKERAFGRGHFTLEGIDPRDGDLTNDDADPLLLRSTGVSGQARHTVEVLLEPIGPALNVLQHAAHTRGQLHIRSGKSLKVRNASIYTSGALRNDGTITGHVFANTVTSTGTIIGSLTTGASAQVLPANDIAETYASMGTLLSLSSNTIERFALGPGHNPFGKKDSQGVYIIRTNSDLTIRRCRIYGTLVIINPGKKVTFDNELLIHPYNSNYPSLIITGNAVFNFTSAPPTTLSESAHSTNFNPPGVPYQRSADSDTVDHYPSEIRGLVHVKGTVSFGGPALLRGALLSESTASSSALEINNAVEIVYDETLFTSPPLGYTMRGKMALVPGTYRRRID